MLGCVNFMELSNKNNTWKMKSELKKNYVGKKAAQQVLVVLEEPWPVF